MTNKNDEQQLLNLNSLKTSLEPPAKLEERIVSDLQKRKLLHSKRRLPWGRIIFAAAACFLFFMLGRVYEKYQFPKQSSRGPAVSMSDSTYVLFLKVGSNYQKPANDRQQSDRVEAYRNWAVSLRSKGIPVSGTKLRSEKSILGGSQTGQQDDVAGYFLIDAKDPDQARNIAGSCPHLKYGGTIEIRRVHPV